MLGGEGGMVGGAGGEGGGVCPARQKFVDSCS